MTESTMLADAEALADVVNSGDDFDPDAARAVLRLSFSMEQQARMQELAEGHNRGELRDSEREEMASYRRVGNFLALLHAKARLSLEGKTYEESEAGKATVSLARIYEILGERFHSGRVETAARHNEHQP